MSIDSFENLFRKGLELTVRIRYQDGFRDRLAVVKLVTNDNRHYITIRYRKEEPYRLSKLELPVSDIRVILTADSSNDGSCTKIPLVQLARYRGNPVSICFPSKSSRDTFATMLSEWLNQIGVTVKVLDWL
jgi:hypothetical protein